MNQASHYIDLLDWLVGPVDRVSAMTATLNRDIEVEDSDAKVTISLTSPFCPVAGQIVDEAKAAVEGVDGVESAEVELTFEPPWTPDRINPLIRSSLGL